MKAASHLGWWEDSLAAALDEEMTRMEASRAPWELEDDVRYRRITELWTAAFELRSA